MEYKSNEVLKKFIEYFKENDHKQIKNSSIIPQGDNSLLFINAGMAPIKRCFTGEQEPESPRMCNVQTCIRTNDIESVGDRHHLTSFHMLGSWSVGDYFKEKAVELAYNLLVNHLHIPKEKLFATVFSGDKEHNLPADDESSIYWEKVGIDKTHILALPFEDNFWRMGDGECPCGPCTEVFYDSGEANGSDYLKTGEFDTKKRYLEIWNAGVFMQYFQNADGTFTNLKFKSVDTGAGLERLLLTLNHLDSVYETDLFKPAMDKIKELASVYNVLSARIIADHVRSSMIMFNANLTPSNAQAGYILRRLLRRAFRHARKMELTDEQFMQIVETTYDNYKNIFPEFLTASKEKIVQDFKDEQDKFSKMLKDGLKVFNSYVEEQENLGNKLLPAEKTFKLYDTFGFPIEITQELACEHGLEVDEKAFNELLAKHKELSKNNNAIFKSGLADVEPQTVAHHTATHLMHSALKKILGDSVHQSGSNVTNERLRFDFNFDRKMTPEEIKAVEDLVNEQIKRELPITCEHMTPDEAKASGAIGLFGNKYGEDVSVYTMGDFSKEICSGPHLNNTNELSYFKILKEESSSAGIRRIKAVAPLKNENK